MDRAHEEEFVGRAHEEEFVGRAHEEVLLVAVVVVEELVEHLSSVHLSRLLLAFSARGTPRPLQPVVRGADNTLANNEAVKSVSFGF